MNKILIVGDLHLGKGAPLGKPGIGNQLNSRIEDQVTLLNWVYETAVERHVGLIIITGDICEHVKPDYILIEFLLDFLKKCISSNIDVEIIGGNHDFERTGSKCTSFLDLIVAMDLPKINVRKNITTIFVDGAGITLIPFRNRFFSGHKTNEEAIDSLAGQLVYEAASVPPGWSKIVVGHLAIKGSIFVGDEFDNESKELMIPADTFADYDYVWMGHVHRPQVCKKEKPYVAHVGSLDISDFGEMDHKKHIILFDVNAYNKIKEIEVPTRPLRHILVEVPLGVDSTVFVKGKIDSIHKQLSLGGAIVRLVVKLLDENCESINREEIESKIYGYGAFYICNFSESKNISVISINEQQDIENTIQPKEAIDIWADQIGLESKQEIDDFKEYASNLVSEVGS